MVGGGFLCFCAARMVTLVAISAAQRAGASFSTSSESDCYAESLACFGDNDYGDICDSCLSEYDRTSYDECSWAAIDAVDTSAETYCGYMSPIVPCCVDEASEHACMDDEVFLKYMQCYTVSSGCEVSDLSCIGYGSWASLSSQDQNSGGVSSGGVSSGGVRSGGVSSGGVSSGGVSTEGVSSGDVSPDGASSGYASSGDEGMDAISSAEVSSVEGGSGGVSSGEASSEGVTSEDISNSRADSTGKPSSVSVACVLVLAGVLGLVA